MGTDDDPRAHDPSTAGVPEAPAEPAEARASRSYAPIFLKGCGFTLLAIVLGVGVVVASKGDSAAVGSALFGVVFLLLVLSSSGLTGFWGDKS